MILLGLTGSIAMGKSTTAQMFRDAGVPVFDADAAVHDAYLKGGAAYQPIGGLVPDAMDEQGLNRDALKRAIAGDPSLLTRIESIVHPIVRQLREDAISAARDAGVELFVLDIPLLFETNGADSVDKVLVVTAPADIQRERALARPGMTPEQFERILARQTPDAQKRERADFLIDTSLGLDAARQSVLETINTLTSKSAGRH